MPEKISLYDRVTGEVTRCFSITAIDAVKRFPDRFSLEPWTDAGKAAPEAPAEPAPPATPVVPPAAPGDVDVPADWRSLKHFSMIALANEIAGTDNRKMKRAEAEAIITGYLSALATAEG